MTLHHISAFGCFGDHTIENRNAFFLCFYIVGCEFNIRHGLDFWLVIPEITDSDAFSGGIFLNRYKKARLHFWGNRAKSFIFKLLSLYIQFGVFSMTFDKLSSWSYFIP